MYKISVPVMNCNLKRQDRDKILNEKNASEIGLPEKPQEKYGHYFDNIGLPW